MPDDPLADSILARHGAFPDPAKVGIDYGELLLQATLAVNVAIDKDAPLPLQLLQHPSFNYLSRHGLRRHYTVRPGWDFEGYFVGDAGSLDDLAYFWNLRAADISLEFLDPSHIARYERFKPECDKLILARVANLADYRRNIAIWTREERIQSALGLFEGRRVSACRIGDDRFWKGGAVRPFKIPGVRRLLKTFGPRDTFTRNVALGTIGRKDLRNPFGSFDSHKGLHIESRDVGQPLTPAMVFEYLVEKGLFRIGANLLCPSCNLESWIALDVLKQQNVCELCGISFDATRQLVDGVFHYRRTGVLGLKPQILKCWEVRRRIWLRQRN